jgi:hypothetical protein
MQDMIMQLVTLHFAACTLQVLSCALDCFSAQTASGMMLASLWAAALMLWLDVAGSLVALQC